MAESPASNRIAFAECILETGLRGGPAKKSWDSDPIFSRAVHSLQSSLVRSNREKWAPLAYFAGKGAEVPCSKDLLAEGEGFEPPVPFQAQRFSRPPVSTTHTSLRGKGAAGLTPKVVYNKGRGRLKEADRQQARASGPRHTWRFVVSLPIGSNQKPAIRIPRPPRSAIKNKSGCGRRDRGGIRA